MTYNVSSNNPQMAVIGTFKITTEELLASDEKYKSIKNTPQDFQYVYGAGGGIEASNLSQKTTSIYKTNEVSDNRALGLNSLALERVELSLGITTNSKEVSEVVNKQVLNSVTDTLKEFGLTSSLPSSLQSYTQDDTLESVNSMINQGAQQIVAQGGTAKELDDFLYAMSQSVDETVDELKTTFSDEVSTEKDQIFGLPTTATLRVWQQTDVKVDVVSQTFNITNSDGDLVEIKASYANSQSMQSDDFNRTQKELNVDIKSGSLNEKEQQAFNRFLDDFANVTNAILAGDEESAKEAYNNINPADYGFQSIDKVNENIYEKYDNEAALHIYNEEMGHDSAVSLVRGEFDGAHQDQSIIKGGQFHGEVRDSVADLGQFDIKFANSHEKAINAPFVLGTNDAFESKKNSEILGFSKGYGKDADGTIMQDESGEVFRYQYNSEDRDASGWQKLDKEQVDLAALQVKDYFSQFKLEIIKDTGQVLIKDTESDKVIAADTKLAYPDSEKDTA